MNDICLCIRTKTETLHSIGVNKDGRYYSEEYGGYLDLTRHLDIFTYVEMSWQQLRNYVDMEAIK